MLITRFNDVSLFAHGVFDTTPTGENWLQRSCGANVFKINSPFPVNMKLGYCLTSCRFPLKGVIVSKNLFVYLELEAYETCDRGRKVNH